MKSTYILPLFTALLSSTALAGSAEMDSKTMTVPPSAKPPIEINFRASSEYVGSSDFRYRPAGDQDALHSQVLAGVSIPLNENAYYTINGFYDRFDFGTSLAPVPTTLQKVGADLTFEYRLADEVPFVITLSPGLYGSEINSDSFNIPITAYGSYRLSPSVVAVAGARYNNWSQYQIIPSFGVVWTINEHWKLRAIASNPKIEYKPNKDFIITLGGELTGGTYQTAKSEQNYPGKHLDYYDVRAGTNITYRGLKSVDISLTAGWSFERNLRYDDIDVEYRTKGAPYIGIAARAVF